VVIGHKATLTGSVGVGGEMDESKRAWKRLVERCEVVDVKQAGFVSAPG
jgi:hypothetical protein